MSKGKERVKPKSQERVSEVLVLVWDPKQVMNQRGRVAGIGPLAIHRVEGGVAAGNLRKTEAAWSRGGMANTERTKKGVRFLSVWSQRSRF